TYEIDYNGYRARLITMHEVIQMLGWYETVDDDTKADDVALANAYYEAFMTAAEDVNKNVLEADYDTYKEYLLAQIEYMKTNYSELMLEDFMHVDLLDYLDDNGNTTVWGYWTSTAVAGYSSQAWRVYCIGNLVYDHVTYTDYGVRPVISLTSNIFE
ncbi:MAG: hypothetical protein IJZ36_03225, partial [Bacilli bacterium]|nr:hypothetical protein [Bacilli bacterium]